MNESQASKAVFITAAILLVAAVLENNHVARDKRDPGKFFKRLWLIGVLTLLLSITADFVPEVAGPVALLILTSVVVHDSQMFGYLVDSNTTTKKAGKK